MIRAVSALSLRFAAAWLFVLTLGSVAGWSADAIPPKRPALEFAQTHEVSGVAVSPDGRTLAYHVGQDKDWVLQLRDWESGKITTVTSGAAPTAPVWLNRGRVLFGRGASVDRDGRNLVSRGPSPYALLFHRWPDDKADEVLALGHDEPLATFYDERFVLRYVRVDRFNTRTGRFVREVENPGQVVQWLPDRNGAVNVAVMDDGDRQAVLQRSGAEAPWQAVPMLDGIRDRVRVHGLSGDGKTLWISRPDEKGRWCLVAFDLERQTMGELLLGHDYYDILPRLVLSPRERELLGVRWTADKDRTFWLHPGMAAVQQALDKALPETVNSIVSLSDDLQRMVVIATSARNPGVYFQFDRAKVELKPLFALRPWVDATKMAEMFAASYKSRDGLTIHGYLTVPAGREAKNLPLVVRPNASFWSRVTWGYDPLTQFLANRGYAVLQVNPRGSFGYGDEFHRQGRRRVGKEVQEDIADGTLWAIAQGIADPDRIAILGEGEGGYSALMNVAQNPGLYKAAVSIDGVTDWSAHLFHLATLHPSLLVGSREVIGDPGTEADALAAISPSKLVDRIDASVLLVNGNSGLISRETARSFATALRQTKRPHEIVAKFDDIEGLAMPKPRTQLLETIDAFFAKHLRAGRAR